MSHLPIHSLVSELRKLFKKSSRVKPQKQKYNLYTRLPMLPKAKPVETQNGHFILK